VGVADDKSGDICSRDPGELDCPLPETPPEESAHEREVVTERCWRQPALFAEVFSIIANDRTVWLLRRRRWLGSQNSFPY
jgi:hypothetical protein